MRSRLIMCLSLIAVCTAASVVSAEAPRRSSENIGAVSKTVATGAPLQRDVVTPSFAVQAESVAVRDSIDAANVPTTREVIASTAVFAVGFIGFEFTAVILVAKMFGPERSTSDESLVAMSPAQLDFYTRMNAGAGNGSGLGVGWPS